MEWLTLAFGLVTGSVLGLFTALVFVLRSNFIYGLVSGYADQFIQDLPSLIEKNPEIVQNLTKRLVASAMKELGVGKEPGRQSMKIGGFRIPPELVDLGIKMLGGRLQQSAEQAAESLLP